MNLPIAALVGLLALAPPAPAAPPLPAVPASPDFLFDLATATGAAESTWATVTYDRKREELFTVHNALVHIFNQAAMETFTFGGDGDLGAVERVAVFDSGDI
ncbi:MAG: hypothetical protein WCS72_15950, partial [Deltaproteobacteria bacterium]